MGKHNRIKKRARIDIVSVIILLMIGGIVLYFTTRSSEPDFNCGNNICDFRESITCSQDCKSGGETICGDGFCDIGEVCKTDCGGSKSPEYCGDGICQENRESRDDCSTDCGLPLPECGNGICQSFIGSGISIDESLSCPQDCGIICGDNKCVINPYDERINCPSDCNVQVVCGNGICQSGESQLSCPSDCLSIDNDDLIYKLNQKQRPLVGGLSIEMPREDNFALCTLGAIVEKVGVRYILTAGHCVTDGEDGFPDPDDIGLEIRQGGQIIGSVYKTDFTGGVDVALILINPEIDSKQETFLGDEVLEFGTAIKGLKVFKIGRTTGLTYGTITEFVEYTDSNGGQWKGFEVTGDNEEFSKSGDSGSAIITISKPHKIVGIISAGDGSNMPEDIKIKLGL